MTQINTLTKSQVLELVPQAVPFRFIDEILQLDDEGIVASYQFKNNESFYEGHFPGNPITPGVILLETAAQAAVVAYGIYICAKTLPDENVKNILTLFTDAQVEFSGSVKPGDKVIVSAKKIFFRRLKLKSEFVMKLESGQVVCSGTLSGMGVKV